MRIHFIGIGGVSMSALAKLMLLFGEQVSGSDRYYSENFSTLGEWGGEVYLGEDESVVERADLVVYTASIPKENKELSYAIARGKKIISRDYFLREVSLEYDSTIAVAGTHGKTTVTAMIGEVLLEGGYSFTAHVGGNTDLGNLIYKGKDIFLTEACEFNRSFLALQPDVAVILNVEFDHPDTYQNIQKVYESFSAFIGNVRRGGLVVMNADAKYYEMARCSYKNICTYSLKGTADFRATNIINYHNGYYGFRIEEKGHPNVDIKLGVAGVHNVENALACYATCVRLGVERSLVRRAIENFSGVRGRMEQVGVRDGARIFYDYAHHPTEILSAVRTAKELNPKGKLRVIFQPHTLQRTRALMGEFATCFDGVDDLYIFKEYLARKESGGSSAYDLYLAIKERRECTYFDTSIELCSMIAKKLNREDLVLVLGAGDVREIAHLLKK